MSKRNDKDARMAGLYIEQERARCLQILVKMKYQYDQEAAGYAALPVRYESDLQKQFVAESVSAALRLAIEQIKGEVTV